MNFLVVGNPGVGKSTLLNGMVGSLKFKSGFSPGEGLTFQFDKASADGNNYFDTPGLADMKKREEAAKAIEEALKQNGCYKIIFVIFLQSGRVLPDDVATIQCVLNACPIIGNNYGIVINKVPESVVKQVKEKIEIICASIFSGSIPPTAFIHINVKDKDLDDENDKFKPVTPELQKFIQVLPSITIAPKDVAQIDTKNYDKVVEEYQKLISKLSSDAAEMTKRMAAQQESFQEMVSLWVFLKKYVSQEQIQDREERMQRMHDERMTQQQDLMEKQMQEQCSRESRQEQMMKDQQENHAQQMAAMQSQQGGGGGILGEILGAIPVVGGTIKDLKRI